MIVTLDFETRSFADLRRVGVWPYSQDVTTDVICLCYKIGDGPVCDWWPNQHGGYSYDGTPDDLLPAVERGDLFEAHNVAFEISIWKNVMVARYGWPDIPLHLWRDSMATASYFAMPPALDRLAKALGLPGKDPEGSKLITKYCKLHLKTAKREIPPEDFEKFLRYCRQDVVTEHACSEILGDLPDAEVPIFLLDLETNLRGLYLDQEGIAVAAKVVDDRAEALTTEFRALTGLNPTQGVKLLPWFAEHGVNVDNLQAETLEDLMEAGAIPAGPARRAVQIRLAINKASTKKLDAMARNCGSDGRARFQTRYHGASTGRSTGSGFQPLNLTRGFDGMDPDQLVRDIMYADASWLDCCYGDAMLAVSNASRYWITAQPGNVIYAGDFVSVEAVILACLAGETWKIEAFRRKDKIYEMTADKVYLLPPGTVTKKTHPQERQDGKTCLGAGTLVLTRAGYLPLIDITTLDELWDGASWVRHDGVLAQGPKETINWLGLEITPDHEILCGQQWRAAGMVASSASTSRRALATGSANLPWLGSSSALAAVSSRYGFDVPAASASIWPPRAIYAPERRPVALNALAQQPALGSRISGASPTSAPTMRIGAASSTAFPPASPDASPTATLITARAASAFTSRGPSAKRGGARIWRTFSRFPAGIARSWRLIVSKWMGGTSPAISASSPAPSTPRTNAASATCSAASLNLRPVYDIANAGPLRRFTVLTDAGPILVHNCELAFGYQGALGAWLKFDSSGRHSDERIIEICKAWRSEHPRTVQFWGELERAALRAVRGKGVEVVEPSGIEFQVIDNWLTMRLPNGKLIWYFDPQLRAAMPQWHQPATKDDCAAGTCDCEPRTQLTYMAQKEGQWRRVNTYGGKLCLAEGTPVLTQEGWVAIEAVADDALLWDGEEWVSYGGKLINGLQRTISAHGVRMTPDHEVLTEEGWQRASQSERYNRAACRLPNGDAVRWQQWSQIPVARGVRLRESGAVRRERVSEARQARDHSLVRMRETGYAVGGQDHARDEPVPSLRSLAQHDRPLPAADASSVAQLRRPGHLGLRELAAFVSEFLGRHGSDVCARPVYRPHKQQRALRAWELPVDDSEGPAEQFEAVYDLTNCGPRRRFTVRSSDGRPLIVHNCENATQATSREAMEPAKRRLAAAGYNPILTVYDEIVCEVPKGFGSIEEFEEIMAQSPGPWADGWPIAVDAWTGERYRK